MLFFCSINVPETECLENMNDKAGKNRAKKKIIIESFAVFLIAMVPIMFKLYDFLPGPSDENALTPISFLGIEIGSNGFDSVETNVWFYTIKLVPLILLLIWFFTSKDWWYHILIIPIATYAFQLFELFFFEDDSVDTENIWWLLPICMVVIPFVYFIRVKLYDKYVHGIDLEAMDAELEVLKSKSDLSDIPDSALLKEDQELIHQESISDELDRKLSTRNLEERIKQFQLRLQSLLNLNNK